MATLLYRRVEQRPEAAARPAMATMAVRTVALPSDALDAMEVWGEPEGIHTRRRLRALLRLLRRRARAAARKVAQRLGLIRLGARCVVGDGLALWPVAIGAVLWALLVGGVGQDALGFIGEVRAILAR